MPGRQLDGTVDFISGPNLTLLKAHKSLPRRRVVTTPPSATFVHVQKSNHPYTNGYDQYRSAERIQSWIPEPSSVRSAPDHGLPLTPPLNSMEHLECTEKRKTTNTSHQRSTGQRKASSSVITPIPPQSPPTPETTPPRVKKGTQTVSTPPVAEDESVRTDSFRTAKENPSSDEEHAELDSLSLHPSRQKWLRQTKHVRPKDIGLGLGLELEDEEPTPKATTPRELREPSQNHDFVTFDGAWGTNGLIGADADAALKEAKNIPAPIVSKKRRSKRSRALTLPPSGQVAPKIDPSLDRSISLRQRIERSLHSPPTASMENFAEQINWPLEDNDVGLGGKLPRSDDRRFSQISTTSTVEAAIVETPPQRKRTLRHTGKIPSGAYTDSPLTRSNRSSLNSTEHVPKRPLRRSKSPEGDLRRISLASDNSSAARARRDSKSVRICPTP